MSTVSQLANIIKITQRDESATIGALADAYRADFAHFATANNRQPLEQAASMLGKTAKDKAIASAIVDGQKASGLVTGYIGAKTGKFSAQPDDVRQRYTDAIDTAAAAFRESLTTSGVFAAPVPKTQEEKEAAKAAKAAKAQEVVDTAIAAMIQSGELVRADQVATIDSLSALALAEQLEKIGAANLGTEAGNVLAALVGLPTVMHAYQALQAEHAALQAEHAALQAEHAALQAEHAALQAARATKTRKAKVTA